MFFCLWFFKCLLYCKIGQTWKYFLLTIKLFVKTCKMFYQIFFWQNIQPLSPSLIFTILQWLTFQFNGDWNFVVVGGGYSLDQNIEWCRGGSNYGWDLRGANGGWEAPVLGPSSCLWLDLVVYTRKFWFRSHEIPVILKWHKWSIYH